MRASQLGAFVLRSSSSSSFGAPTAGPVSSPSLYHQLSLHSQSYSTNPSARIPMLSPSLGHPEHSFSHPSARPSLLAQAHSIKESYPLDSAAGHSCVPLPYSSLSPAVSTSPSLHGCPSACHWAAERHGVMASVKGMGSSRRMYSVKPATAAETPLQSETRTPTSSSTLCEGVQDEDVPVEPGAGGGCTHGGVCPEGVQGEECDQFRVWLRTCLDNGRDTGLTPDDCVKLAEEHFAGRKTLEEVFSEYERQVGVNAALRGADTSTTTDGAAASTTGASASGEGEQVTEGTGAGGKGSGELTQRQRLKLAVRDYGSMVMVFHIGCALMSLGTFYALISSNVDVVGLMSSIPGVSATTLEQAAGVSTLAVAYAAHKLTAPVRIGITITCAPVMVRYLRARNILKAPKASK